MSEYLFNVELAKRKGFSDDQINILQSAYQNLFAVLKRPEMYAETGEEAVREVQFWESHLQILWGFPKDPDFHHYHFKIKGCICPTMDNDERIGTPYRVVMNDCKFHGNNKHKELIIE